MTFDAIAAGDAIFVDANVLLYYFTAHPRYGSACQKLLDRIDNKKSLALLRPMSSVKPCTGS